MSLTRDIGHAQPQPRWGTEVNRSARSQASPAGLGRRTPLGPRQFTRWCEAPRLELPELTPPPPPASQGPPASRPRAPPNPNRAGEPRSTDRRVARLLRPDSGGVHRSARASSTAGATSTASNCSRYPPAPPQAGRERSATGRALRNPTRRDASQTNPSRRGRASVSSLTWLDVGPPAPSPGGQRPKDRV